MNATERQDGHSYGRTRLPALGIGLVVSIGLIVWAARATTESVDGYLVDGTHYVIVDPPSTNYEPLGLSGVIMVDLDTEPEIALGKTGYSRVIGQNAEPKVSWLDDQLRVEAGDWFMGVDVYPQVLEHLGADRIANAIEPRLVSGFMTIDLSPPLRWQQPSEIPARISVRYSDFTVSIGCPVATSPNTQEANTLVCSDDGVVSLRLSEGITSAEMPEIRVAPDER